MEAKQKDRQCNVTMELQSCHMSSHHRTHQNKLLYDTRIDVNCRKCFFSSCAQIREIQIGTSETEIKEYLTAVS